MALISMVSGVAHTDMPPLAQASEREAGLPWWAWLLIVMILAWLLVRWLNRRQTQDVSQSTLRRSDSPAPTASIAISPAAVASSAVVEAPPHPAVVESSAVDLAEPVSAVVEAPPAAVAEPIPAAVVEAPPSIEPVHAAVVEPAPAQPDDLTIVEGIGPKISALLLRSGIRTFGELAVTDVERLRQILHEVGYRVNDPTTWPEQARLAAAGDWDRLKALQDELKGGRRV